MLSISDGSVTLDTPATCGNFGPGFDAISLAIRRLGDRVTLSRGEEDRLQVTGAGAAGIPESWDENIAGPTLDRLRDRTDVDEALAVQLVKPRRCGSGLGSSASSAGGVALAFHALFPDARLTAAELVEAAGRAEARGGEPHFDDVAAVVMGGLSMVRETGDGLVLGRVAPPDDLHLAIVVPEMQLETARMRELLPEAVARSAAVENLADLAALVDAFHRDDVATIAACLDDAIAAPARSVELPFYEDVREAARATGAPSATIAGSGPSMIAVHGSQPAAERTAKAMVAAVESHGLTAEAVTARPEPEVPFDVATMR